MIGSRVGLDSKKLSRWDVGNYDPLRIERDEMMNQTRGEL